MILYLLTKKSLKNCPNYNNVNKKKQWQIIFPNFPCKNVPTNDIFYGGRNLKKHSLTNKKYSNWYFV